MLEILMVINNEKKFSFKDSSKMCISYKYQISDTYFYIFRQIVNKRCIMSVDLYIHAIVCFVYIQIHP